MTHFLCDILSPFLGPLHDKRSSIATCEESLEKVFWIEQRSRKTYLESFKKWTPICCRKRLYQLLRITDANHCSAAAELPPAHARLEQLWLLLSMVLLPIRTRNFSQSEAERVESIVSGLLHFLWVRLPPCIAAAEQSMRRCPCAASGKAAWWSLQALRRWIHLFLVLFMPLNSCGTTLRATATPQGPPAPSTTKIHPSIAPGISSTAANSPQQLQQLLLLHMPCNTFQMALEKVTNSIIGHAYRNNGSVEVLENWCSCAENQPLSGSRVGPIKSRRRPAGALLAASRRRQRRRYTREASCSSSSASFSSTDEESITSDDDMPLADLKDFEAQKQQR